MRRSNRHCTMATTSSPPSFVTNLTNSNSEQRRQSPFDCSTAPHLYNTQSGVPPREAPFRAIDLGEVALRPHPT